MMYKAKVAVYSDIRTKHSTQSERRVEFLNVKTWRYVKKPLEVKRLMLKFSICPTKVYFTYDRVVKGQTLEVETNKTGNVRARSCNHCRSKKINKCYIF